MTKNQMWNQLKWTHVHVNCSVCSKECKVALYMRPHWYDYDLVLCKKCFIGGK
nr:MAG: hypothetical protein [Microvirus Sku211]